MYSVVDVVALYLREYIRATGYDLIGQQCMLNSRHTDCTDIGPKKSVCVVSSVLG
jgi:hypothetical protein